MDVIIGGASLTCPHCPADSQRLFTKRGLSIHITRKHGPRPNLSQHSQSSGTQIPLISLNIDQPGCLERLGTYRSNMRILKHIPKGARNMAAGKLRSIIDKCLQTNAVEDWYSLLFFAYVAFRVPENKSGDKSLTSRVKESLAEGIMNDSPVYGLGRPPSRCKAIESKVYDGDLRGAVRLLTSDDSLAPADSNTLSSLRDKHPVPQRPITDLVEPAPPSQKLIVNEEDVAGALGSFHASSAAGLDGLRPQHLKELTSISAGDNGQLLLQSLTKLCCFLLEGKLHEEVSPFLYGASLCALQKMDGGIRPIAVGSVLRRLVAKLGCRAVGNQMGNILRPHQLGFGSPLGCEAAVHATRTFALNPGHACDVILKIDIKNAFNSVERDVLLAEVRGKIPALYPFLVQCYASPTNLYYNGDKILSQVGAQQGDPLGPLVFSLAINNLIASLKAPLNVWYLDDGTIGGSPNIVAKDLEVLIPGLSEMGLIINGSKCELYPCGEAAREHIGTFHNLLPGLKVLDKGSFSLLGSPIFIDAIPTALQAKRDMLIRAREHLGQLPAHVALTLLRGCLSISKLMYIMRTSPTWHSPTDISQLDEDLRVTLEIILNVHLDEEQWLQASLPVRHGGLGMRRIRDANIPAFLASSCGVRGLVANILQIQGDNLTVPHTGEALSAWSAACCTDDFPEDRGVQRQWDDRLCRVRYEQLLATAMGADIARLKAVSSPESGAWLHALPSPHMGTILDDSSLRVAVAIRLGCDVCEPHSCVCGALVDAKGRHGLSCSKAAGRFPRHYMLNEVIRRALVSVGVPCTLEPPGLFRSDGKRPDGLTLIPWERGRCLVWDATCVSTFASSHLTRTIRTSGAAAEWAATQKHNKYAPLKSSYLFVPFAVEVSGVWSVEARGFVRELGRRLRNNGSDLRAESYLMQRISLAIQRGNAASVMSTFASGTIRGGLFD